VELLYLVIPFAFLAIAAALAAGLSTRRTQLARLIVQRAPLDLPREAANWLIPPSRLNFLAGYFPTVIAAALAIASGIRSGHGWTAVLLASIVFRVATWIGEEHGKVGGPLPPAFMQMARRARERSARPSTVGDPVAGPKAYALAQWIEALCHSAPHLTIEEFEPYYTAYQVADILQDTYFGQCGDEELTKWLEQRTRPLYGSPEEEARVALLEEVRQEVAGKPTPERVSEIIARLRR
jgi:hypothetical protein